MYKAMFDIILLSAMLTKNSLLCVPYVFSRHSGALVESMTQPKGRGFDSRSESPCRDLGKVLHLQLPVRYGVKLRCSIRAVVGSTSGWQWTKGRYKNGRLSSSLLLTLWGVVAQWWIRCIASGGSQGRIQL